MRARIWREREGPWCFDVTGPECLHGGDSPTWKQALAEVFAELDAHRPVQG